MKNALTMFLGLTLVVGCTFRRDRSRVQADITEEKTVKNPTVLFPGVVGIVTKGSGKNSNYDLRCGAARIGARLYLTAAHCLFDYKSNSDYYSHFKEDHAGKIYLYSGEVLDSSNPDEDSLHEVKVTWRQAHTDFVKYHKVHAFNDDLSIPDVGLFEVSETLPGTWETISQEANYDLGDFAMVGGYGPVDKNAEKLQLSFSEAFVVEVAGHPIFTIEDDHVRYVGGDSGSPAFARNQKTNRYEIIGVANGKRNLDGKSYAFSFLSRLQSVRNFRQLIEQRLQPKKP